MHKAGEAGRPTAEHLIMVSASPSCPSLPAWFTPEQLRARQVSELLSHTWAEAVAKAPLCWSKSLSDSPDLASLQ